MDVEVISHVTNVEKTEHNVTCIQLFLTQSLSTSVTH